MLKDYLKFIKAYDVRGVFQKEIDENFVYIMGKAIGKYFQEKYGLDGKFLIAKDVRPANDIIIPFFIKGMFESGLSIDNIFFTGLCSTSVSYSVGQNDFDLSVNFTASHNPPEFVGMKFFDKNTVFLSQSFVREIFQKEYEKNIKSDIFSPKFQQETKEIYSKLQNNSQNTIISSKISQLFSFLSGKYDKLQKKHKFVVDFSNGASTMFEKHFFEKLQELGHKIFFINENPDGTFPNHLSDTQDHENYQQCIEKIKQEDAEFGIMFDGDADRIGFVGPDGKVVGGDILLTILAKQVLKNFNGTNKKIIYEVMCSKVIKEEVEKIGGDAVLYKMGRFFIKEKMDEIGAVLGGETSGHFMFQEIGGYEMPLLALFYIIQELEQNDGFVQMVKKYIKYFKSPVLSKKVENKEQTISNIQKKYSDFNQELIDGVSVFGDGFWFNVRCSNTENKVRYTLEADDSNTLKTQLSKLEQIL